MGERLTILEVRLRDEAVMPHVMELGVAERASRFKCRSSVHLLENTATGRAFLQENGEKNLAIRTFLVREFTRIVPPGQEHLFKLSVAIAEKLMDSTRIDGIEYPSIVGKGLDNKGGANRTFAICRFFCCKWLRMNAGLSKVFTTSSDAGR